VEVNDLNLVAPAPYVVAYIIAINIAVANQNGCRDVRKQLKYVQSFSIGMCGEHIELSGFEN
jgi:hypothetical protein